MEEKNVSKLKEEVNDILVNLSINTITDDLKIVTFLQELKQRKMDVIINKNLEIGRIIEIIKRNY